MDIDSLPEELKPFIEEQLASGRSLDELVCEGLRLLSFNEELFAANRAELNEQIAEGVAAEKRGELHDGPEAIADAWAAVEKRRGGE